MVDEKTRILREEEKKRMKEEGLKHFDQDPKKKRVEGTIMRDIKYSKPSKEWRPTKKFCSGIHINLQTGETTHNYVVAKTKEAEKEAEEETLKVVAKFWETILGDKYDQFITDVKYQVDKHGTKKSSEVWNKAMKKEIKITEEDVKTIYGKEYELFQSKFLPNCFCGKCAKNGKPAVRIENFTTFLNDMDDIVLKGFCAECGGKIGRYIELSTVYRFYKGIEKVKQKYKII
jgi:hypothetical protein